MPEWHPGDRVTHPSFGLGTVLQCDDRHVTIHFDQGGRRKFASSLVVLTASASRYGSAPTTGSESPTPRKKEPNHGQPAVVPAGLPSTIDQLIDLARRKVGSEESLNQFVSSMRRALPGPTHPHVGVLSGMRVQVFQNWLLDENPKWQLTDAQLLAVMRVEFPLATGLVHMGDVDTGLKQIAGIRTHYNRDGHSGPSPISRDMPDSVSYGRF